MSNQEMPEPLRQPSYRSQTTEICRSDNSCEVARNVDDAKPQLLRAAENVDEDGCDMRFETQLQLITSQDTHQIQRKENSMKVLVTTTAAVSLTIWTVSYTHLTLPTKRIV